MTHFMFPRHYSQATTTHSTSLPYALTSCCGLLTLLNDTWLGHNVYTTDVTQPLKIILLSKRNF